MACLPDASGQRAHPCAVWHLRALADQTPISGPGSAASAGLIGGVAGNGIESFDEQSF